MGGGGVSVEMEFVFGVVGVSFDGETRHYIYINTIKCITIHFLGLVCMVFVVLNYLLWFVRLRYIYIYLYIFIFIYEYLITDG